MAAKYVVQWNRADGEQPNEAMLLDAAGLKSFLASLSLEQGDYVMLERNDQRTSV